MNTLCLATNLTSTEMAAWVQAVGSILTILGAFMIAGWQARRQFTNALALQRDERQHAKFQTAETLALLVRNCLKAIEHLSSQVGSREAVYEIGEGRIHFDIVQIGRLDDAVADIPLHDLPAELLQQTLVLGATLRQYREKVEQVLRVHRDMNASDFEDFFASLTSLRNCLSAICDDISAEVERLRSGSDKTA